jgi:hypothetical protein
LRQGAGVAEQNAPKNDPRVLDYLRALARGSTELPVKLTPEAIAMLSVHAGLHFGAHLWGEVAGRILKRLSRKG